MDLHFYYNENAQGVTWSVGIRHGAFDCCAAERSPRFSPGKGKKYLFRVGIFRKLLHQEQCIVYNNYV